MSTFKPFLLLALILISSSFPVRGLSQGKYKPCALYLDIQTMSDPNAGTTSNVSIALSDGRNDPLVIPNVFEWNREPLPPYYVPFQSGKLDLFFFGPVDCSLFSTAPCYINVTITGTGSSPTWGLDYIKVDSPVDGIKAHFSIGEWLTPKNNFNVFKARICPRFSKGMTGYTKGSLAI